MVPFGLIYYRSMFAAPKLQPNQGPDRTDHLWGKPPGDHVPMQYRSCSCVGEMGKSNQA